jgi:hypothetical protein
MATLTEEQIIDVVYALYETDDTGWASTSDEYLAARKYCNVAINRWEHYDNTEWRELWTKLTDAADGDKTTDGTNQYDCPTNFVRPGSWVRVGTTFYTVITPEKVAKYANSQDKFCYFSGNSSAGFKLNFNANLSMSTGDTIYYEYYKSATTFTATTSKTEMADPYFIVYFVLARFIKNDGEDNMEEIRESDEKLEQMRVTNLVGYYDLPDQIESTLNELFGFEE